MFHYSVRAECQRNVSESIQKLITDTLAFDKNVKLNSLFYKGDEERVTVCCNMETLGEHKALLDRLVSRLRSRSEVYSAGWEKKEAHRRTSNSDIMLRAQTRMIEEQHFIPSNR